MTNKQKVLGLIGLATKAGKTVFGREACADAIEKRKVSLIIVALDASDRTKKDISDLCDKNGIPIKMFATIDEISNQIGKDNKAIIGIKDKNLSDEILKIINGGDIIG